MQRILTVVMVLLLSASISCAGENGQETKDEIVARVGEDVITAKQLDEKVNDLISLTGYKIEDIPEEILKANKKDILQKMTNDLALDIYARENNIKVADDAVDEFSKKIKSNFGSDEEFANFISRQGFSESSFMDTLRRELVIEKIISGRGYADPTEEELKNFYNEQVHNFKHQESVKASHILVSFDKYPEEEALKRITEIREKIKNPAEDFDKLAREYSDCPSSQRGGDLGFFDRGKMVKPFEETSFSLDKGTLSDPVKTQFGYHLILVTDKRGEGTYPFEEKKEEIFNVLKRSRTSKYTNEFFTELKEKYKIEILL